MNQSLSMQNSSSITDDESGYYLNVIGHGIIVPIICFIGMILNSINFCVLMHKDLKTSSYTYLTSLAVADFFSLFFFGTNGIGRGHFPDSFPWSLYERCVYFPFALITTNASVFMIVAVTAERYVFLYHPLKAKFWCTQQSARKAVTILWIISIIMNVPRFFVFSIDKGNLGYTTFGKSKVYTFMSWFYFLAFAVGCGVILIILNFLLIRGIHAHNKRRKALHSSSVKSNTKSSDHHEEVRLTRTLISVIILYLVGELPSCIFSRMVFAAILGNNNKGILNELWYQSCVCVATIFAVSQHSLNFVFYCVFNKRFYHIFRKKFSKCCPSKTLDYQNDKSTCDDESNNQILLTKTCVENE